MADGRHSHSVMVRVENAARHQRRATQPHSSRSSCVACTGRLSLGQSPIHYFEEFPDYLTQGESRKELEENLRDLYRDLTSGEIPAIRRVAELSLV